MTSKMTSPSHVHLHHDGTITVWDVYTQSWTRTAQPRDEVLASLPPVTRERIIAHLTKHTA